MNVQPELETQKIALAFDRGAHHYDQHARVQQQAARTLEERIAAFVPEEHVMRIVDLGCGTGLLTRALALRYPRAAFVACDLAPTMVEKTNETLASVSPGEAHQRFAVLCADAQTATFNPKPDLNVSNFVMQWFADPLGALAHHARRSRFLAWTTLVEGTFATWIAAHELRGMNHGLRRFIDAASIVAACEQLAPLRVQCNIDRIDESFPNAIEFLRGLRSLGAATARADYQSRPIQSVLRAFTDGFTAEYRICTILMEMP